MWPLNCCCKVFVSERQKLESVVACSYHINSCTYWNVSIFYLFFCINFLTSISVPAWKYSFSHFGVEGQEVPFSNLLRFLFRTLFCFYVLFLFKFGTFIDLTRRHEAVKYVHTQFLFDFKLVYVCLITSSSWYSY